MGMSMTLGGAMGSCRYGPIHPTLIQCTQGACEGRGSKVVDYWTWELLTCGCKRCQLLGITSEVMEIARDHIYVQGKCMRGSKRSGVVREWMDVPLQVGILSEAFLEKVSLHYQNSGGTISSNIFSPSFSIVFSAMA
jgi:hypothetical protein